MKPRLNANSVILVVVVGVVALVGLDAVRGSMRPQVSVKPSTQTQQPTPTFTNDPGFRVGETAPDFALPNRFGNDQRLSSLVRGDTLLFTTCGCAQCLDLQNYVGILLRHMGPKAPQVINVTTMPKDRELTWIRDTRLPQTILYEQKSGPVIAMYRGHPCPRVFRLEPGLKVTWIGPSIKDARSLEGVGDAVTANLGFTRAEARALAPMHD